MNITPFARLNFRLTVNVFPLRRLCTKTKADLPKCFGILGVNPDSDQEAVRLAFLKLVKKYHPDSGNPEADVNKFREIESAYRAVQEEFSRRRWQVNEGLGEYGLYYEEKETAKDVEEFDIKHTAPQHRQYLSYGGVGMGTPFQREKQYTSYRAAKAANSLNAYKIGRLQDKMEGNIVAKNKAKQKNIKTGLGIERLVEDLIQESIARGDFDNLSGEGKPLEKKGHHDNPYVDFVTHKMNQVLIDNGFKPAWIMIQREVHDLTTEVKNLLRKERARLGPIPLSPEEATIWEYVKKNLDHKVKFLNSRINTYNLVVPILQKQLLQFDLKRASEEILETSPPKQAETLSQPKEERKGLLKKIVDYSLSVINGK